MKRSAITRRTLLQRGKPLKRGARLKARKTPKAFRQRRDPDYAAWVRTQLCMIQGYQTGDGFHQCRGRVQGCHVKSRGAGGDDHANMVPLCAKAHEEQHRVGILTFQGRYGVELLSRAADYWERYQRETGAP